MNPFKKQKPQPEPSVGVLQKHIENLEEQLSGLRQELQEHRQEMKKAVTKVGVVRYNPFGEIGGDQSFSVAMLDHGKNGVVVTSYYGRDQNRVYAKPVEKGSSRYELTREEKEAINQAIGAEIQKSNIKNQNDR